MSQLSPSVRIAEIPSRSHRNSEPTTEQRKPATRPEKFGKASPKSGPSVIDRTRAILRSGHRNQPEPIRLPRARSVTFPLTAEVTRPSGTGPNMWCTT
ncbi:hypothetical protein RHA1_ro00606 [Rhodococcus jostii RHA1]|uniref:Uncharacterized protein n=1 Tax=Rhodococcus jostii (strain RHA1) TaxID=101510 RepID=Q0SJ45_RHOJR|nr:hypothetical protein RHA1_ro00606 [Rhodococcus jostii RHA1]